jgi:AraC-like DNA-binding protein
MSTEASELFFDASEIVMYDQIREDTLYIMLYAVVTATAMMACCYLLFRRANAIAPDITPPARLRRWTAVFFAVLVLNHLWYMPIFYISSSEDIMMTDLIGGLLDSMTVFPVAIIVLLAMLQDRRRPLWPIAAMMAPIVVVGAFNIATRSFAILPIVYIYFLLMCIGFIVYMVRALRQYGRWLRENYADLEHKEVWQSFVVLAIIMLVFVIYVFTSEGPVYQYAMQVICIVLICYLLWRVETLSDLSIKSIDDLQIDNLRFDSDDRDSSAVRTDDAQLSVHNNIGPLLQKYCIDTQLYLQHDLNLSQLAKAVGTNRFYLSQYFSNQGLTYNAYINNLRVDHFVSLYREAVDAHRSFTAQQLALESGFRSYNTFSSAFKRKTSLSVTAWIKAAHQDGKANEGQE